MCTRVGVHVCVSMCVGEREKEKERMCEYSCVCECVCDCVYAYLRINVLLSLFVSGNGMGCTIGRLLKNISLFCRISSL